MRVFVTGAGGFIGGAVAAELSRAGHQVLGLARSDESERALREAGVEVQHGSLEDPESLSAGTDKAQAVIHLAFDHDFTKLVRTCDVDRQAIATIGAALAGSDKPFLVAAGMAGLAPAGQLLTEAVDVPAGYRLPRASEQAALRLAADGTLVSVVRLAQVHDTRRQGLVTSLIGIARHAGVSAYVGEGRQRWPAVHVSDAARLFRLALEKRLPGGVKYHAVGEQGVDLRVIAEAIGRHLDVPTKSLTADEAQRHFGPMSGFVAADMPASAEETMRALAWRPTGATLAADLGGMAGPA